MTALYSSDEIKALRTAEPAAAAHDLVVQPLPELREVRRPATRIADYAAAVETYLAGEAASRPLLDRWEPLHEAQERAWRGLRRLLAQPSDGATAIVSHGLLITLYASRLLRLGKPFAFWKEIPFAGYARVDPEAGVLLEGFRTE